jgi:copper homeostasis protein
MEAMAEDAAWLAKEEVQGIVFGALDSDYEVDADACKSVLAAFGRPEACFHRAFDQTRDPEIALAIIAELGFVRILTSGMAASAMEGLGELKRMVGHAQIQIMPGGGIRSHNARAIIEATGCDQLHLAPFVDGRIDTAEVQCVRRIVGQTEETA